MDVVGREEVNDNAITCIEIVMHGVIEITFIMIK